jgi:glucose dehydrogenase
VYAGFGDVQVRAFDVATGEIRWEAAVRSDSSPLTSAAFADGDLFVVDGTGGLYRIDGRTGDLEWEFQFPSFFIWGSPLVAGDRVFVGTQDGTLAAVDLSTGHRVWQRRVNAPPVGALAPAGERLLVPLLGRGGGLLALEHDPAGVVGDVASPTTLRPEVALLNFAAGFAAVLGGGLLLAAAAFRGRRSPNRARASGHGRDHAPSSERIDR